jgi:hypothetical protein
MNQLLDLAREAYAGLETFSRLGFPTLRRVRAVGACIATIAEWPSH